MPTWRRFQREFVPDWKLDEIQLVLSQKLATIVTDVPVTLDLDQARPESFNLKAVRSSLSRAGIPVFSSPPGCIVSLSKSKPIVTQQLNLFSTEKPVLIGTPAPSPSRCRSLIPLNVRSAHGSLTGSADYFPWIPKPLPRIPCGLSW